MPMTTRSALMAAMLSLAALTTQSMTQSSHAQDQEEGALELEGPSPAPEASSAPAAPAATESRYETPSEAGERTSGGTAPSNLRFSAGLRIGVGGGFQPEENRNVSPSNAKTVQPARLTPGFALGADYVLHRYFAIGGETRFDWASINDGNKWMLWSLMAKPRLRHQLKEFPIELYFAVPGGLSVTSSQQKNQSGKVGGTLGLAGGMNYFFGPHWGLNAELGWTWHWMRFQNKYPGSPINGVPSFPSVDYEVRFGQMALALNAVYAL
jgi:hypothetical protein